MNTLFTQYYRMPLLVLFLAFGWIMIGLRLVSFLRVRRQDLSSASGWTSFIGTGVTLTIFAGILATVYIILNVAVYALDQEIFKFFAPVATTSNQTAVAIDPATISSSDVEWLMRILRSMLLMLSVGRAFLVLILWVIKGSLYAIYCQSQIILGGPTLFVVASTGPILICTGAIAVWVVAQSLMIGFLSPTSADIRNGAYMDGVTFNQLDDASEMVISGMNVITDALLTFIAYKAIRALRHPVSATWMLCLMGFITIGIALVRLVFVVFSVTCEGPCLDAGTLDRIITPEAFLAECEVFTALVVTCLPAFRASLRAREESLSPGTQACDGWVSPRGRKLS